MFLLCALALSLSGCSLLGSSMLDSQQSYIEQVAPPVDNSPEALKRYELDIQKAKAMNEAAYKERLLREEQKNRFHRTIREMLVGTGQQQVQSPPPLIGRHSTIDVNVKHAN